MRKLFTEAQRRVLHEATYEADAAARAEANKVWDAVVRYVKAMMERGKSFSKHRSSGGFALVGVSGIPDGLGIILAPKGTQTGIGSVPGRTVIIVGGVLLRPYDHTYLDTRIESGRGSFVHEYTHYLDQHRRKGDAWSRAAKQAADKGDIGSYFRTPEEFNAWYQETAHLVQDDVERTLRVVTQSDNPLVAEVLLGKLHKDLVTFPAFLSYAHSKGRTAEAVEAFKGTTWERRWLKRLHGLYSALKQMVQETQ
jgi:hypothetical protein